MIKPRILLVVNAEWYFVSHRMALAKTLQAAGFEVVVAAAVERDMQQAIESQGLRFVPLHLQRRSTSPLRELRSIAELVRLYRAERPLLVHHLTIKPVLYGSLVAKLTHCSRVINTIPGLGYVFMESGWQRRLLRACVSAGYRAALSGSSTRVIFQNPDNRDVFLQHHLVSARQTILIRGSGVDVKRFSPSEAPGGVPVILLASRLLWDKGIGELVEAARFLRKRAMQFRMVLVGVPDQENPSAVPLRVLEDWQSEGIVEWWGLRSDMPNVLRAASIVVLPTYAEGLPKVLLEASACACPIVATDVPGCREIVRHGENGLLVPARDPVALADALQQLLNDPELRCRMGQRGREMAVSEFSEERVNTQTLAVYRELLSEHWPRTGQV